jgi:hypothetical protein
MAKSISLVGMSFDVDQANFEIDRANAWNLHTLRTDRHGTPHNQISDIWVRFNPWENYAGDPWKFTMEQHESDWYPIADELPAVLRIVEEVFKQVGGKELGGVLITQIPPGHEVKPHIDSGWHAGYYEKYAVQLKGNKEQGFYFEGEELHPEAGQTYTFDNSKLHWVKNDSDEYRRTLIICIRTV